MAITTNVVATGYSRASQRRRPAPVLISTIAHHTAQPTCRLGIAAQSLTTASLLAATVPKTWWTTAVSTMPGTARRGGATGYNQKTAREPKLVTTRAERNRPYTSGRRRKSQISRDVVTP